MAEKTTKITKKRLPKGQRTHLRRVKQEARKAIGTNLPPGPPLLIP